MYRNNDKTGCFEARLQQAPVSVERDDVWGHLCCQLALQASDAGHYPVGAVLVNQDNELVTVAHNEVFAEGYHSQRHAEMVLIDRLENDFPQLNRRTLTLYVSLEPCLMCSGRILLSGIGRIRYLAADNMGGFASHLNSGLLSPLPPAWQNLASGVSIKPAKVQAFWRDFARDCVDENAGSMREKVVTAWAGKDAGSGMEKNNVKKREIPDPASPFKGFPDRTLHRPLITTGTEGGKAF